MKKSIFHLWILAIAFLIGNLSEGKEASSAPKELPNWEIGVSLPSNLADMDNVLAACKKEGFTWVEVYPTNNSGQSSEENLSTFKKAIDKAGLKIWSVHFHNGRNNLCSIEEKDRAQAEQFLQESLDLYKKTLGTYYKAVLHSSAEPVDPAKRAGKLKALCESVKKWAPKIQNEYNVQLCIEALPRTCLLNCSKEALDTLNGTPEAGLCFDTNHIDVEKPHDYVKATAHLISTLHVCDYDGIREKHWIPGKGIIEWTPLMGALAKAGYKAPIIFEVTTDTWERDGTMPEFFKELAAAWKKIRTDYAQAQQ